MVIKVTSSDEFKRRVEEAKTAGKLIVVDFFAEWCGPCKLLAPKLEQIDTLLSGVIFLKVDVDQLEALSREYQITAMPTIIFIKDGEKVDQIIGNDLPQLKTKLEIHSGNKINF